MANQRHLDYLKQGVELWNRWRDDYAEIQPDLMGANLSQAELAGVNLSKSTLMGTNFGGANLQHANLSQSSLRGVNLMCANLRGANLSRTNLWDAHLGNQNVGYAHLAQANLSYSELGGVDFGQTNLYNANLTGAELGGVNMSNADLTRADFTGAIMAGTLLGNRDLRTIKGLETVQHRLPSPLSVHTIFLSEGDIPDVFLRGIGAPEGFIEYVRSLTQMPIEYYTCFICYASSDEYFARQLYHDLQARGVRCWFAPEDLKIGDKLRLRIDESIRIHEKLLLVLSASSITSQWVEQEVETALEREREEGRTVLFPIRVDNAIMESKGGWSTFIRNTRHIGDFTCWKQHDVYQKAFERLLYDLKANDRQEGVNGATLSL